MYIGFNGENWFQAQDEQVKAWLVEMLPTAEERLCLRFRQDKVDSDPADIDKLLDLDAHFKAASRGLDVIFCASINESAEDAFAKLQTVINGGVNVIAVEFGNETYSKEQTNFDFELYKSKFLPLFGKIKEVYPEMPCLVFLAPRPKESGVLGGRNDHSKFNNAAIAYINSEPTVFPTVHIYLNSRECPTLNERPANVAFNTANTYQEWSDFYAQVKTEAMNNFTLWTKTLDYISSNCHGKGIYITEWGFDNYGTIKNTLAIGIVGWNIWLTFSQDSRITALCQHNGVSMATPGMMFPSNEKDLNPDSHPILRRVDYFVHQLFRELRAAGRTDKPYTAFYSEEGAEIEDLEYMYIAGNHLYSSSGATDWMGRGTVPSYEVSGISSGGTIDPIVLPKVSIGIYREKPVPKFPPVADAGPDLVLTLGRRTNSVTTTISGEDSYDIDGDIISYTWYHNGEVVGNTEKISVTFTKEGEYLYDLSVTDEDGIESVLKDTVKITVRKRRYFLGFIPLPSFY